MFASRYIEKNIVYHRFIGDKISSSVFLIVMVPCLNEPEITRTLESLWACSPVNSSCEVIVVVNDPEGSSKEVKAFNQDCYLKLQDWKRENDCGNMVLHPIYAQSVEARHAGAGMARKIGMDEAVRRFNDLNRPEGVIVSLDADCLVSANYLQKIETAFASDKSCFAATVNFKHRVEEATDARQRQGIRLYEDYLHYYKKALDFTGFPNSTYTIGSAFAVRADAYAKQGGMNRRQAGEDFYFLNKLTNLGKIFEIEDAFVFPSARVSDRVPFGTGAAMTKWMNSEGDLTLTYNFDAFIDLKMLFDRVGLLYRIKDDEYAGIKAALPVSVLDYMSSIGFDAKLAEINKHSSSFASFKKRFFQFFDAFLVMRFLNLSHPRFYPRQDLLKAIASLEDHCS